jgi:ankyrin repeat protein
MGPHGLTALTLAVHDSRKVALLLAAGADPEASGDWGFTPLLMASLTAGARDSVALLLQEGASVERRAVNGAVPLFAASSRGDFETVELLMRAGARFEPALLSTALVYAANCGDTDSARSLLALGAPIDAPALQDHTPLTAAAIASYEDCLRLFLDAGADPEVAGAEGLTALAWAAKVDPGHSRIVGALLAAGADPKRSRGGLPTPLELAEAFGNAQHLELLRD